MNDIEMAIEFIENAIKLCDLGGNIMEPASTYYKLALQALQEKQARDEGCEYCNSDKHIRNQVNTLEFADGTIIDNHGITVSLAKTIQNDKPLMFIDISTSEVDLQFGIKANFCPMCGRKLEKEA